MELFRQKLDTPRKQMYFALAAVFVWGLFAHGYGFFHTLASHDSLNEFNAADGGNAWKIQLGRVLVPLYRAVFRTDLTLPWMIGILSLVWTGLAVYLVLRIFQIQSKGFAFLTAGIFTANITVIAGISTYINDHDGNMFALLCAVGAVYLWRKCAWGALPGAALVAVSIGIYQSYISVTITLVLFVCILELMNEKRFRQVFVDGLKAVGMLLLGGILYYLLMQLVLKTTGSTLSSGGSNSLETAMALTPQTILSLSVSAYRDAAIRLMEVLSPYPDGLVKGITLALGLGIVAAVAVSLGNKRIGWMEKALCLVLLCLIPLGMHILFVLTFSIVHDLMVFALWLFYLLGLLMIHWLAERIPAGKIDAGKILRGISLSMVFVLLYGNVQTANGVYLKKDLEREAFLSLMTRVVYRMESCDGYEPGTTPVVFVGDAEQLISVIPGFEEYRRITGADFAQTTSMQTNYRAQRYIYYVMGNPAVMAQEPVWSAMQQDPRVARMPSYPEEGSVQILDDVMVVKLG